MRRKRKNWKSDTGDDHIMSTRSRRRRGRRRRVIWCEHPLSCHDNADQQIIRTEIYEKASEQKEREKKGKGWKKTSMMINRELKADHKNEATSM